MRNKWELQMREVGRKGMVAALTLSAAGTPAWPGSQQKGGMDTATTDVHGKFYCNIKALTPEERVSHHALTEKLIANRNATVATAKGYELQYSPDKVSVAELAQWIVTESKCCPFFDFHIDLEEQGTLICLRLTGSEGVKAFIRSEFHL